MDNKQRMVDAINICLTQGGAIGLSMSEITRCLKGRCGEGAMMLHAPELLCAGLLKIGFIPEHANLLV